MASTRNTSQPNSHTHSVSVSGRGNIISTTTCASGEVDGECSEGEDTFYWQQSFTEADEDVMCPKHQRDGLKSLEKHNRVIIHIDIDCFYAQVEMIQNPQLVDIPLGVQQKYLLVTCNYVARERGVKKMMGIKEAKEICPDLVLANGENLTKYREMSYKITEVLKQYTPFVERLGFDENFMDVSNMVAVPPWNEITSPQPIGHVFNDTHETRKECACGCTKRLFIGSHIADEIRQALFKQLGITCCAGVAHNKLLAKLVGGTHKPNQQTVLFPSQADQLLTQLKLVRKIPGIGWSMSKQLAEIEVLTIDDARNCPKETLESLLGEATAQRVKELVAGVDESPVTSTGPPQTMSVEDSFRKVSSVSEVKQKLESLIQQLLTRLLEDGRQPATMRLTVRKVSSDKVHHYKRETKQSPIPYGFINTFLRGIDSISDTKEKLLNQFMLLFYKLVDIHKTFHLSLINVAFANFNEKSPEKGSISKFFKPSTSCNNMDATQNTVEKRCFDRVGNDSSQQLKKKFRSSMDLFVERSGTCTQSLASSSAEKNDNGLTALAYSRQDIDIHTLNELPEDIRREIERDLHLVEPTIELDKKDHASDLYRNMNKEETGEEKTVCKHDERKNTSSYDDVSVTSNHTNVTSQDKEIPPDIKREIFVQLPLDIQDELVEEWKQKHNKKMMHDRCKAKNVKGQVKSKPNAPDIKKFFMKQ